MNQSNEVPDIPIEDSPFIRILWSRVYKAADKLRRMLLPHYFTKIFGKYSNLKGVLLQIARKSLSSKHFGILFRVMYLDMYYMYYN